MNQYQQKSVSFFGLLLLFNIISLITFVITICQNRGEAADLASLSLYSLAGFFFMYYLVEYFFCRDLIFPCLSFLRNPSSFLKAAHARIEKKITGTTMDPGLGNKVILIENCDKTCTDNDGKFSKLLLNVHTSNSQSHSEKHPCTCVQSNLCLCQLAPGEGSSPRKQ